MNPRDLILAVAVSALAVASTLGGPTVGRRAAPPAVPFECFTSVWDAPFELLSTRYDKPNNRVIWVLKARKDSPVAAYEAFVADPDGVEVATLKVKFAPAVATVKAGVKIQAYLPLGYSAGEPAKITIRAKR